jgi:hypothetical protein
VFLGTAFGSPLNERFWKENSPFVYARTANLQGLKIYFDCGDQIIMVSMPACANWTSF